MPKKTSVLNVPNVLPCAEACLGLRIRKDIWDIWTLVLFDEMTPTFKLQSLMCRAILPKGTCVYNVLPYAEA